MIKTRKIIIGIMTMIVFSSVTACSSSTNNENSNMISSEEISSEDMTFLDQHENTVEEACAEGDVIGLYATGYKASYSTTSVTVMALIACIDKQVIHYA